MADARSEVVSLDGSVQGLLRVSCVPAFGRRHVTPHLASLAERHPALSVELELTERVVDPVLERFDLVIRIGDQPDSSLVCQRIGSQRYIMGASPAYLRRHGRPTRFEDLAQHRLIDRQHSTGARGWRELAGFDWTPGRQQFVLESNDCDARRMCAAQGLGIALMPNWAIGEDLAAGRIVELDLEGAPKPEPSGIYLLRAGQRASVKVRAFTQHLLDSIGRSASWVQRRRDGDGLSGCGGGSPLRCRATRRDPLRRAVRGPRIRPPPVARQAPARPGRHPARSHATLSCHATPCRSASAAKGPHGERRPVVVAGRGRHGRAAAAVPALHWRCRCSPSAARSPPRPRCTVTWSPSGTG